MNKKAREFYGMSTSDKPEDMFADVLDKDEKVVKTYKPDKKKFHWSIRWVIWFTFLWIYPCALIGLSSDIAMDPWLFAGIWVGATTVALILTSMITRIFTSMYYNNRYYAYTNRRIIVRSGVFGVDYKCLDFKTMTATIAKVSLLDRLLRRKTGSLFFGSPSAPVAGVFGTNMANPYRFSHIVDPYGNLREIKEVIGKDNK